MATSRPSAPPPRLQRPAVAMPPAYMPRQTSAALAAAAQNQLTVLAANNVRLSAVAERLELYFRGGISLTPSDLFHLVFALARGIDYALSSNDIPGIAKRLRSLIKQVYQRRNDPSLQSAIMVLMISAKNACKNGWFSSPDENELLSMGNELCSSFCISMSDTSDTFVGNAKDIISKIIPRFYPQLKFSRLVISFEAKPGYDILMADFHIARNIPPDQKICLLVVQTDNLDTSSCIISPQHVSFLVNGKGIERRTNVSMDSGPQFPTDITKMLKYGTNIIQAIGYFSGSYIIAIAFIGRITTPAAPTLEDYVHPVIEKTVSDSDIIEGPSRITLNCPISFKRIKIPVKGHLCKHHQCFDYDNFMEMNFRKPSWRCPCCNTPTSGIDLRIDQNIVKVLQEVGEDIADIVIFADGSWKAFVEHNKSINQVHKVRSGQQETSNENGSTLTGVVDLTMEEDYASDIAKCSEEVTPSHGYAYRAENIICELEDRKPFRDIEGLPVSLDTSGAPVTSTPIDILAAVYNTGDGILPWNLPSVSSSTSGRTGGGNANALGTLESLVPNVVLNPIQTDAVSPALNRVLTGLEFSQSTPTFQQASQGMPLAENLQLQPLHLAGSIITNEAGRPPIPRHVSRTPIAVQALPAQTQPPSSSRRVHIGSSNSNSMINSITSISHQAFSPTTMASGLSSISSQMQIEQHFRTSNMASVPSQLHSITPEPHQHSNSALQRVGVPAPSLVGTSAPQGQLRVADPYRATVHSPSDYQNPQQLLYQRGHHSANLSSISWPSRNPSSQVLQASRSPVFPTAAGPSLSIRSSAERAAQPATAQTGAARIPVTTRVPSFPTVVDMDGTLPSSGSHGASELPYERNWQPTGRMRGSLTGSAYDAALSQYLVAPTQPAQSRPPPSSVDGSTDQLLVSPVNSLNVQPPIIQHVSTRRADSNDQSTGSYGL
ncbi:E4 SUMO-protein ligase PIAL2-like isoform X1 [Musa acuminata AAA Group]|uniref:E4 SUMO-protein ligase PIAL2-like isoform X1 n=2 Tax=Musa acuminata AAA Group TaxID=214697 RepID=UPI0031D3934C